MHPPELVPQLGGPSRLRSWVTRSQRVTGGAPPQEAAGAPPLLTHATGISTSSTQTQACGLSRSTCRSVPRVLVCERGQRPLSRLGLSEELRKTGWGRLRGPLTHPVCSHSPLWASGQNRPHSETQRETRGRPGPPRGRWGVGTRGGCSCSGRPSQRLARLQKACG